MIKSNIGNEVYQTLIKCRCGKLVPEYHIDKNGFCLKCANCTAQFPKFGSITIPGEYKQLNQYFNITINVNNTTMDEDDIDLDAEKLNIFDDERKNCLLTKYLEIQSHTNLLDIIRYYVLQNEEMYGCFEYIGKIDNRATWYEWNAKRWRSTDNPNMDKIYRQIELDYKRISGKVKSKALKKVLSRIRKSCGDMATRSNILNAWMQIHINEEFDEKVDSSPYLVGFENGVYDLLQGCFRDQEKKDYITMSVGYKYVEKGNGKEQEIQKFFEVIMPNAENRHFLLKMLASTLLGMNKEERLSIFTGETRNGKGALTELMKYTLGEYIGVTTGSFIQGERPDASSPQPDLINFRKKRLVILNEIDENKQLNTQFVKNLVGNDIINCRTLYSPRNIEFKAQFKLILNCNKRPPLDADKVDIWSKIYLLLFPMTFVNTQEEILNDTYKLKDNDLKEKMKDWKVDMMNILIRYYKLYLVEGLEFTEEIKGAIGQEKRENDPYTDFVEANLVKKEGGSVKVSDVLDMFNRGAKPMEKKKYKDVFCKKLGIIIVIDRNNGRARWLDWEFTEREFL